MSQETGEGGSSLIDYKPIHMRLPNQVFDYRRELSELYLAFKSGKYFILAKLRDRIESGLRIVGLMAGSRLVAVATIVPAHSALKSCCRIEEVTVHPNYRGFGLGRLLMEKVIAFVQNEMPWCEYLELTSNPEREAANHIYQELGFELYASGKTNLYRKYLKGERD